MEYAQKQEHKTREAVIDALQMVDNHEHTDGSDPQPFPDRRGLAIARTKLEEALLWLDSASQRTERSREPAGGGAPINVTKPVLSDADIGRVVAGD